MQNWSITETYLARKTWNIETHNNEGACQAMQRFADQSEHAYPVDTHRHLR